MTAPAPDLPKVLPLTKNTCLIVIIKIITVKKKPTHITHRIHGAAIYGNMDPINIPPLC